MRETDKSVVIAKNELVSGHGNEGLVVLQVEQERYGPLDEVAHGVGLSGQSLQPKTSNRLDKKKTRSFTRRGIFGTVIFWSLLTESSGTNWRIFLCW